MATPTWEEAEFLLQIARDASLGRSFEDRFGAISESLLTLVPGVALSAMLVEPPSRGALSQSFSYNQDPQEVIRYLTHYRQHDPMQHGIPAATGEPLLLSDCIHDRDFGRDPFTGELLRDLDVRHLMGVSLEVPGERQLAVAIHRADAHGDFTKHERRLVRIVSEDLGRAAMGVVLRDQLERLAKQGEANLYPHAGGLLLNLREGITKADAGATYLLRRFARWLSVESLEADARALMAQSREGDSISRLIPLEGEGALRVSTTALDSQPRTREVMVVLEWLAPVSNEGRFDEVAEVAKLTKRERQVARLAVAGRGNQGIAHELSISPITVGVHLTKIYRKTGVGGRFELAQLMG